jgi:hypothetical protein
MVRTSNPTGATLSRSVALVGGAQGARVRPEQPPDVASKWVWKDGQWCIAPGSYDLARQQALGIPLKASEVRAQRLTASEREAVYQQLKAEALRNPMGSVPIKAAETTDANLGARRDRQAQALIRMMAETGVTMGYKAALLQVLEAERAA